MKKLLLCTLLASPLLLFSQGSASASQSEEEESSDTRQLTLMDRVDHGLGSLTKACSTVVAVERAPEAFLDAILAARNPGLHNKLATQAVGFRLGVGVAAAASACTHYSLLHPSTNTAAQNLAAFFGLVNTGIVATNIYLLAQGKLSQPVKN